MENKVFKVALNLYGSMKEEHYVRTAHDAVVRFIFYACMADLITDDDAQVMFDYFEKKADNDLVDE